MSRKKFFLLTFFLFFGRGEIFAQIHFIVGKVQTEDKQPVYNAEVSILGIGSSDMTTQKGNFKIDLPDNINIGDPITLEVSYRNYVIKSPVYGLDVGKIIVPSDPFSNPIIIVIVPRGSLSLLTDAEIRKEFTVKNVNNQLKKKKISFNQFLSELADKWGLPETVLRDSVENWYNREKTKKGLLPPSVNYFEEEKSLLPDKLPKIENEANTYFQLGNDYFLGDSKKAEYYYKLAIKIQPSHINAIIMLGELLKFQKEYNKALICYKEALSLSIKIHSKSSQKALECFTHIGIVYFDIGNYENAIYNFQEALKIIEENYNTDFPQKAKIMKNIRDSYLLLGEYSKAFKYSDELKKIQSNLNREDQ